MSRTLGQRIFLALWVLWALLTSLAGLLGLIEGSPMPALGVMLAVGLIVGIPIALIQFVCLGSAKPSALAPR